MKVSLICLLVCLFFNVYGQMDKYKFKRELFGITDQWHKIDLPNEIFKNLNPNLSDIRIFGITENQDTVEAQYILEEAQEEVTNKNVSFRLINKSHNNDSYFFTFEISNKETINQIIPNFSQQNFDWELLLEGSQDQQNWFTIVDNYRILSIKNRLTDYQFTKISFPDSKYRYYRMMINSKKQPGLLATQINLFEKTNANYRYYQITTVSKTELKDTKETEIFVALKYPVPVSYVNLNIDKSIDFYRSVKIQYLQDSVKTEKGWKYNYRPLTSGNLSSIENSEYKFQSRIFQNLKIIISNNDNKPLNVYSIIVKGNLHYLKARFTDNANYFLTYGKQYIPKPNYDIDHFANTIPDSLSTLKLGEKQMNQVPELETEEPLFKNKWWLWIIMIMLISLLGWFSLGMIRKR